MVTIKVIFVKKEMVLTTDKLDWTPNEDKMSVRLMKRLLKKTQAVLVTDRFGRFSMKLMFGPTYTVVNTGIDWATDVQEWLNSHAKATNIVVFFDKTEPMHTLSKYGVRCGKLGLITYLRAGHILRKEYVNHVLTKLGGFSRRSF